MPWLARWQWPFIAMLGALATSQTLHHSRLRPEQGWSTLSWNLLRFLNTVQSYPFAPLV